MTDITPEAVERLIACFEEFMITEGVRLECVWEERETLRALSAALERSQAETAAAYEAAACLIDDAGDVVVTGALGMQLCCNGYMCGCRGSDVGSYLQHLIRALTPADSKAALDRVVAEAEARGMREAADKLILVGKDEYTNDFNRGFDRGIEWSRNAILAAIPKGQANE